MTRRRKKSDAPRVSVLTFIFLGAILAIGLDYLLGPKVPVHRAPVRTPIVASALETRAAPTLPPHSASVRPAPQPLGPPVPPDAIVPQAGISARPPTPSALPAWREYAQASDAPPGAKTIAIILDDVGIDRKRAIEAIALPPAVTLAFLP